MRPGRSSARRYAFILGALLIGIAVSYVFFVTGGTWSRVTRQQYAYYTKLADGFLKFQTAVAIDPNPALLRPNALNDPTARAELLWDLSFYKGKYYIYWGYVPALVIAAGKLAGYRAMTDAHVTFLFQLVRVLAASVLMLEVLRRCSPVQHTALFIAGVLATAWAAPFPYALGRAAVYEAAITGGQSFVAVGLLLLFLAANEPTERWRMRLIVSGGVSFGAALCCRLVLLPALLAVAAVSWWLMRRGPEGGVAGQKLALSLFGPLLAALVSLGVYNYVRFESPFEFGLSYIRTYPFPKQTMSTIYLKANLWNYFVRPPAVVGTFPFVKAPWDAYKTTPPPLPQPRGYMNREPVIGLVQGVPVALFSVLGVWHAWRRRRDMLSIARAAADQREESALSWLILSAGVFALVSLLTMSLYYACTMRYIADFLPAMLLAAFLGVFLQVRQGPAARAITAAFCVLAGITCVVGWLLWTDSYIDLLRSRNPAMHAYLVTLFGGS